MAWARTLSRNFVILFKLGLDSELNQITILLLMNRNDIIDLLFLLTLVGVLSKILPISVI